MSQKTEQDIFWAIPSSVPATNEELETPGAALYPEDVKKMASDSGVLCLGEIMNFKDLSADGYSKTREMIRLCKEEAPLMTIPSRPRSRYWKKRILACFWSCSLSLCGLRW